MNGALPRHPLVVIHRDEFLCGIDKPSGLLFHRTALHRGAGQIAVQVLRGQIGRHVYPVHRLDRGTSDVLPFALDAELARQVSAQFLGREVGKRYLAVVRGHPTEAGTIDHPLARRRDDYDPPLPTQGPAEPQFVGVPIPPLQFLAVPLSAVALFSGFVTPGIARRRDAQAHKRLMLLASFQMVTPALARWPMVGAFGPPAFCGRTDLFLVALAVWDLRSRGRLHPVTLWGGLLMVTAQPAQLMLSGTESWLGFAGWTTGLGG